MFYVHTVHTTTLSFEDDTTILNNMNLYCIKYKCIYKSRVINTNNKHLVTAGDLKMHNNL